MFLCPKCSTPIGEVGPRGSLIATCASCRYRFEAVRGELAGRSSRKIALHYAATRRTGPYEREHELRLRLPAGGIEAFTFRRPGSEEPIGMREGDTLIITHSLRDEIREELLFITNETTGAQLKFSDPGASAAGTATALAIGLGAIIALGAGTNGASVPVSLLIFALVAAPSRFFLGRAYAPRQSLDAGGLAELGARQSWLGKKAELMRLREQAAADAGEKQLMRDQLQQLREKMTSVDSAAYADRLATIARATAALDAQLDLDRRLLDGYDRSIRMMEIEYESRLASEELDRGLDDRIDAKLDELRVLQEQHVELSRQLEANVEVERLLKGARDG